MPKQSKTVDLRGFSASEMRRLSAAVFLLDDRAPLPDAVLPALLRIQGAARAEAKAVYRVPRQSLRALVEALRPRLHDVQNRELREAVAKIDARLSRKPGRPATADLWEQRAADVRRVRRELRQQLRYEPTDDAVAAALGVPPGTVRTWRQRHPGIFGAPESR